MNFEGWHIPLPISNLVSTPPRGFNYEIKQRNSYSDNWSGVSNSYQRDITVSPHKFEVKESREYSVDQCRLNILKAISPAKEEKCRDTNKKFAICQRKKLKDNSPHGKVKMEIYLEKSNRGGVFVTKVRVGDRKRWQDVKHEKQSLRYHPAIKRLQTVMSAIETFKDHRTFQVSLTKEEAQRYKAGDLLEGSGGSWVKILGRPKSTDRLGPSNSKLKAAITPQQVNNYYQQNTYVFSSAGPSTSAEICEEDGDECIEYGSDSDED